MTNQIKAPVLLIAFNRPETTGKVFQKIREAKPTKLYVAVDGARQHKEGETELVEKVKQIVQQVDWKCDTYYKFNNLNLGAEISVSNAVSWALEKNDFVIVLEDDIIASLSFFNFAQQMLEKYANNEKVFMVSSCQGSPFNLPNNEDYLFGIYGHPLGWATWKRAWGKFDLDISDFDNYLHGNALDFLVNNKNEKKYWQKIINVMKKNGPGNNTWDYCWSYIRFKEQGLSIIPRMHLSSNIGVLGLHARGQTDDHYKPYDENFVANYHPFEVKRNIEYDKYHFKNHINRKTPLIKRAFRKALRILTLRK